MLECWRNVQDGAGKIMIHDIQGPGAKLVYRLRDITRAVSQDRRQVAEGDGVMRSYDGSVTSEGEWRM